MAYLSHRGALLLSLVGAVFGAVDLLVPANKAGNRIEGLDAFEFGIQKKVWVCGHRVLEKLD